MPEKILYLPPLAVKAGAGRQGGILWSLIVGSRSKPIEQAEKRSRLLSLAKNNIVRHDTGGRTDRFLRFLEVFPSDSLPQSP